MFKLPEFSNRLNKRIALHTAVIVRFYRVRGLLFF